METPIADDPLGVSIHRLSNGLTVYLSPNRLEPRVYYEIIVRAGSRCDPADATGIAHYLEHMQFKGTTRLGTLDYASEKPHLDRIEVLYDQLFGVQNAEKRLKISAEIDRENQAAARYGVPNDIDNIFSSAGFRSVNAHTTPDSTVYMGNFPCNRAELWASVEVDRLRAPVYRQFLPELEAVYEEYNRYRDDAGNALYCAAVNALFKRHPYGRDVIGLGAHLKNPSLSRMHQFFQAYYRPNNMAIVLSGDFERKKMLSLIERHFGQLKPAPIPAGPPGEIAKPKGVEASEIRYQAQEMVRLGWLLPEYTHPDKDALVLMDSLMDNHWAGILNLSVNKRQLVKSSGASPIFLREAGTWFVWASTKSGQKLEQAEQVLLEAVGRLKHGDFSDDDFKAVIVEFEIKAKERLERNSARAGFIRDSFIRGESWSDAVQEIERLKRVTRADVLRVANHYLGEDRVVVYRRKGEPAVEKIAKPIFTPTPIQTEQRSQFSRELLNRPLRPLSPRFLTRGRDYRILNRAWGRLYSAKNGINDIFDLKLVFPLGTAHEERLKVALKLWKLSGAGEYDAEGFERRLYQLGSTLAAACGERELLVNITGLEKNLEETLRLVILRFLEPKIESGTFEKMIAIDRGSRQNQKLDPRDVFHALSEFARRGKESSVQQDLSVRQHDALTERQLEKVLRRVLDYRCSALYAGKRRGEEILKILSALHGRRRPPSTKAIKLTAAKRARVVFAHRDNLRQALVGAFIADGKFTASARRDYNIFDSCLGGMSGIYFQELREARALAYSAQGGYSQGERLGDDNCCWSSVETQAEKMGETIGLMRDLMRQPPLTAQRFTLALRNREESYRSGVIQPKQIPLQIYAWEKSGFHNDPRRESFQKLRSYKLETLLKFAARFADKPSIFYVLADRNRIDMETLKKIGKFEERSVNDLFPF